MVEGHLPFGERTAQRLVTIANDPRLSNATHVSHLPQSWYTLYELTKVPDLDSRPLSLRIRRRLSPLESDVAPTGAREQVSLVAESDPLPRLTAPYRWVRNPTTLAPPENVVQSL